MSTSHEGQCLSGVVVPGSGAAIPVRDLLLVVAGVVPSGLEA
jgi:hypothetical protein